MKNYFLPALILSALPQFAFACGLLENTSPIEISIIAILSAFALMWLFLFAKNNFTEPSRQKAFLLINKVVLVIILIVSPLWVVIKNFLLLSACLTTPREGYFSFGFPLVVFVASIIFFFVQRKRVVLSRQDALMWFLFWALIGALYLYGYILPKGIPVPASARLI